MAVDKTKDGRWFVHYRKGVNPDDPDRTREYFGRGDAAKAAAELRNQDLGLGRVKRTAQKKMTPTFGDIAYEYQVAKFPRNTHSTRKQRYYKLKSIILPELNNISIERLTPHRLDQYVTKRLATPITVWTGPESKRVKRKLLDADGNPRFVKATTVHRELCDILAVLSWAVKNRKIAFNPCAGYEKPKRDDASIRPPSPAEIRKILFHAPDHLVRYITIAWYTGARPGAVELLRLKWSDVDWDRRCLFIVSARKGGPVRRVVPIEDNFLVMLSKWYKSDGEKDGNHIITFNGAPIKSIKTTWKNTKAAAGITRRLRPYDLRHSFVTYLLEDGADLKSVSSMAGHSRTDTTTRIYQHINMDLMRSTIAKMPSIDLDNTPDHTAYDQDASPVNDQQSDTDI